MIRLAMTYLFRFTMFLFVALCFATLVQAKSFQPSDCSASLSFIGEGNGDLFGWAVDIISDVNADGYDDIIIGAPLNDAADIDAGRVYIFSGVDGDTLFIISGSNQNEEFGTSVCGLGDINSDAYGDFAVGAPGSGSGGSVYIYSGQDGSILTTLSGEAAGDRFGTSIAAAGDANNDGIYDIVVGSHLNDEAGDNTGKAYVFSGSDFFDTLLIAAGEYDDGWFGEDVSGAGDVDNDGYDDVIIAADGINDAVNPGHAYVYSGQNGTLLYKFTGEVIQDRFGITVNGAGDVNNDGYDDIIVGASQNSGGGQWSGRAYIFYGSSTGTTQNVLAVDADMILTGRSAYDRFGVGVTGINDLNGDGFDEIVIGAQISLASDSTGEVFVFSGNDSTLIDHFIGEAHLDRFGHDVASGGDINGDGISDIAINAVLADSGTVADVGRVYVFTVGDIDNDGLPVRCDNCPGIYNPGQGDTDNDGIGDACCCLSIRGNANSDPEDKTNIADVTYLVSYLFGIPNGPLPGCPLEGNVNGDPEEKTNISDVTFLTAYLFGVPNGPAPPSCP